MTHENVKKKCVIFIRMFCLIVLSIFVQNTHFVASDLSFSGRSHVGLLFIGEEHKTFGSWRNWYFCHTRRPCSWRRWAQNGSTHSHVFMPFKRRFITNRTRKSSGKSSGKTAMYRVCIIYIYSISMLLPFSSPLINFRGLIPLVFVSGPMLLVFLSVLSSFCEETCKVKLTGTVFLCNTCTRAQAHTNAHTHTTTTTTTNNNNNDNAFYL